MEKMILKGKMELEILGGAGMNAVTAIANNWEGLGIIAEALQKPGNLDEVQFKKDETVTGEYRNMKLESPLFSVVDVVDEGKICATFGIRKKTEMELAIEQLQRQQAETNASQEVQDGAIMELAGMVGGEV